VTATLLLLGCGTVGMGVLRWLAGRRSFPAILAADREEERARAAAAIDPHRITPVAIDLADRPALVGLMRRATVVLNCAGPFYRWGRPAVEAALEAGTPYVDVNDDATSVAEVLNEPALDARARRDRRVALVGTGTSPGLTTLLVRLGAEGMERVRRVTVALAATMPVRGRAVVEHVLHVLTGPALVYRGGRLVTLPPFSEAEAFTFPEVEGPVLCYAAGHPEPVVIPRFLPGVEEVVMKLGRIPNSLMEALRTLYRWGLLDPRPLPVGPVSLSPRDFLTAFLASEAAGEAFGLRGAPMVSARLVRVEGMAGGKQVEVTVGYTGPPVTAQVAALTAEAVAAGRVPGPGVMGPEALDPRPILREVLKEGGSFRVERREREEGWRE